MTEKTKKTEEKVKEPTKTAKKEGNEVQEIEKKPEEEDDKKKEKEATEQEEAIKDKERIKNLNDIRPGDTIKVYEIVSPLGSSSKKTKEQKNKIQVFEGLVLARKHGKETGATITVRKVVDGIGVEKIFPLLSPTIQKIKIIKRSKVRRAKLYYLREAKGKRARLKAIPFTSEKSKEEEVPKIEKIDEVKENKENNEGEPKE